MEIPKSRPAFGLLCVIYFLNCRTISSELKGPTQPVDPPEPPVTDLDNDVKAAMAIIGAKQNPEQAFCAGSCHGGSNWHELGRDEILRKWLPTTQLMFRCFDESANDAAKIKCFAEPDGRFSSDSIKSLGVYRSGASHTFFSKLFKSTYPSSEDFAREYDRFLKGAGSVPKAQMPLPDDDLQGQVLSEENFEMLIKVFTHQPSEAVEEAINKFFGDIIDSGESCTQKISEEVKTHIKDMRRDGWSNKFLESADNRLKMLGCRYSRTEYDQARDPILKCFGGASGEDANAPSESQVWNTRRNWDVPWAAGWDRAIGTDGRFLKQGIRILSDLKGCKTTFWMRSSADGRFVGNGNRDCEAEDLDERSRGFILDLKTSKLIGVDAPYDPGFFPDNSGFTFISSGSAHFCSQNILLPDSGGQQIGFINLAAQSNRQFCSDGRLSVYQHVGASLDESRYLVVRSDKYANDDGGSDAYRRDPSVNKFALQDSWVDVYKMCRGNKCGQGINADIEKDPGTLYGITQKIRVPIPFEGDFGISPSSRLLTTRIAKRDGTEQIGYRLRLFDIDSSRPSSRSVATVCMKGGKASLSFDERYMVTHHYTNEADWQEFNSSLRGPDKFEGKADTRFTEYIDNSANIWVADLWTGHRYRITFMNPGQFALYPHFRADGWLYFLVRDYNDGNGKNYVVASDVALRLSLKNPIQ